MPKITKKRKSRGMALERRVNKTNLVYRKKSVALIEKIELGFKITKFGAIPLASTVDYKGMVKRGKGPAVGIAFDAKETKNKTSFPLKNIKQHQMEFLRCVQNVGGESYLLIQFTEVHPDHAFLTPINFVLDYWDKQDSGGRKSIPYAEFKDAWSADLDDYLNLL